MTRREWWKTFFRKNQINQGLYKVTIFHAFVQSIFVVPPLFRLLIVFSVATFVFVLVAVKFWGLFSQFVGSEFFPSNSLVGYLYISLGGLVFASTLIVPSLFAFNIILNQPANLWTYIFTFGYAYPVWTFYLVAKNTVAYKH